MLKLPRFARYQLLIHIVALLPLAWLVYDALAGNLSVNPIQDIEQRTGKYALILLVLSLSCTPVNIVTGWSMVTRWRRPLGVYAFVYAALHFLTFIGLDYEFNLDFLLPDITNKRYIFVGAAALLILLPLALTSTKASQRRLGKAWKRLHKWVYLAGGLVIVHYIWAAKSDVQAIAWGIVILIGLIIRTPPVRRFFVRLRSPARTKTVAAKIEPS